ncbi:hypothetical protein MTO96_001269 [Rhipicephalus appendiculatus]
MSVTLQKQGRTWAIIPNVRRLCIARCSRPIAAGTAAAGDARGSPPPGSGFVRRRIHSGSREALLRLSYGDAMPACLAAMRRRRLSGCETLGQILSPYIHRTSGSVAFDRLVQAHRLAGEDILATQVLPQDVAADDISKQQTRRPRRVAEAFQLSCLGNPGSRLRKRPAARWALEPCCDRSREAEHRARVKRSPARGQSSRAPTTVFTAGPDPPSVLEANPPASHAPTGQSLFKRWPTHAGGITSAPTGLAKRRAEMLNRAGL